MARKPKSMAGGDRAAAKAAKQKKLAIALGVVFVALLAFEVPHTMKMMNAKPATPVVSSGPAAPVVTATPAASSGSTPALASPTPASSSGLVSAVAVSADPGQLTEFTEFASKDPFSQTVQKTAPTTTKPAAPAKAPPKPKAPPTPPPTSAVISVNGELSLVTVGAAFPTAGTVFDEVGSPLFQLDTLTKSSAKVSIAGGSYASGAPALTLVVGKPVTLQNTADGTRYTLVLEPQGTVVPTTTATTSGAPAVPTTTTPAAPTTTTPPSVVPSSGSGG
jgi:hypothetical protein